MKFFDAHCHLQLKQFDADRAEVIARMREREVGGIIVGTDLETSTAGLALAKQHDFLLASVGLHPNDNVEEEFDAVAFGELARDPKVVAIGECGLDFFRNDFSEVEKERQLERFQDHIKLALFCSKPLIVHCRPSKDSEDAHEEILKILQFYKRKAGDKLKVITHFFTGTAELAQKYLDLGCYLSFPGPITYTDMYDDSIRVTPVEKILAETDSPFAAPVPFRGTRNEPAYVEEVVKKIAALKNLPAEEMTRQITLNSQQIFGLS